MEYFIPAWHGQLIDWAYNVSHLEIYDAISNMKLLRESKRKVALILTDYQPQFMTKLNQVSFYPDRLFSVFDFLQGINTHESQIFDYLDLNWPDGVRFDFTPFRIMVSYQGHLYAKIFFDFNGRVLNVDYFDLTGKVIKKLICDSRGFVSSVQTPGKTIFYDSMGHWRFKHDQKSDEVEINPLFSFADHHHYRHLNDLVTEVVKKRLLAHLTSNDHLIVTLDDQARVPVATYQDYQTVYVLNQYYPYSGDLKQLGHHDIVINSRQTALAIDPAVTYIVIPAFQAEFKLGHSQRLAKQIVGIFAEKMSYEELKEMLIVLYPHFLKNAASEEIAFLYYNSQKEAEIRRALSALQTAHAGEFVLNRPKKDKLANQLEPEDKLPNLVVKSHRLASIADASNVFDHLRVLVNWNAHDPFIQTLAVNTGIPQLQNFRSLQLIDRKNGLVCHHLPDVARGVSYYLDDLSNWNQALVFNVQLMNAYSADNLLKQWDVVLNDRQVL